MFTMESRAMGFHKFSYFAGFVLLSEWFTLMVTRTHYVIDMITSLFVAHQFFRVSEKLSYYFDVKILGIKG